MGTIWFGWMLHMRRKPNSCRARRAADFALGARDQRVIKLPWAFHRTTGNGAVMTGDEIHQAEIQALDAGQGGNFPHLA